MLYELRAWAAYRASNMIDLRDVDVKFPLAISRRSRVSLLPNWSYSVY